MSYIRCITPMRKRKGDGWFDKTSQVYAYGDLNGLIFICNGWKRVLDQYIKNYGEKKGTKMYNALPSLEKTPMIAVTHAEMRYLCRSYLSRLGELKKRTGGSYDPYPRKRKVK